jgi:hypothetical protein
MIAAAVFIGFLGLVPAALIFPLITPAASSFSSGRYFSNTRGNTRLSICPVISSSVTKAI